eukprot:3941709-Rhodomonas_salina.3
MKPSLDGLPCLAAYHGQVSSYAVPTPCPALTYRTVQYCSTLGRPTPYPVLTESVWCYQAKVPYFKDGKVFFRKWSYALAMRRPVLTYRMLLPDKSVVSDADRGFRSAGTSFSACYAMSGTDLVHGATASTIPLSAYALAVRCPILT